MHNAALYIPTHFANQPIKFRTPYQMAGELDVTANQSGRFFPDATFQHGVNRPFEAWQMYVRLTPIDTNGDILETAFPHIGRRIRLDVHETSLNERLTKAPSIVDTLIDSLAGSEGTWNWRVPFTIVSSQQFSVRADSLAFTNMTAVVTVRIHVAFHGFLLVLEPPSETR